MNQTSSQQDFDDGTFGTIYNDWVKKLEQNFKDKLSNYSMTNLTASINGTTNFHDFLKGVLMLINPENDYDYRKTQLIRNVVIIVFYSLVVIVSLFGNLLVCYVILSKRRMLLKRTNILIVNLAFSDLMMTIINIPLNIIRLLLDNWPFGLFLCKVVPFIQVTSVYVSTFSMTIIAINRYQALISSFEKKIINIRSNQFNSLIIIIFIWILALLLSIPHAIYNEIVHVFTFRFMIRCRVDYPESHYRQWVTLITFLTQYLIPLSITAIVYLLIGIQIWQRARLGAMTKEQINFHAKSKKKTLRILVLVVVVFAVSWFPLNLYHILTDFGSSHYYNSTTFLICHWFAMSSVCYNPFIYFGLNKEYRNGAKALLSKIQCFNSESSSFDGHEYSHNDNQQSPFTGTNLINKTALTTTRKVEMKCLNGLTTKNGIRNSELIKSDYSKTVNSKNKSNVNKSNNINKSNVNKSNNMNKSNNVNKSNVNKSNVNKSNNVNKLNFVDEKLNFVDEKRFRNDFSHMICVPVKQPVDCIRKTSSSSGCSHSSFSASSSASITTNRKLSSFNQFSNNSIVSSDNKVDKNDTFIQDLDKTDEDVQIHYQVEFYRAN